MDPVQVLEPESRDASTFEVDLVLDRFERVVRTRPDAIAATLVSDRDDAFEHQLSYRRLNVVANRIAGLLRAHGVAGESVVAVAVEHDLATIAAILGVMKAGACFLPVDATLPRARLQRIAQESRLSAIVVTAATRSRYEACSAARISIDECLTGGDLGDAGALSSVHAANAAYVIYTSGSSGEPKGVVVTHEGLANHCASVSSILALTSDDGVLQFASLAFDAAYEEIFPCLCSGARLVIRSATMAQDLAALLHRCAERSVTIVDLPTALWQLLTRVLRTGGPKLPDTVRWIVIGGEAAAAADVTYWIESHRERVRLLNTYGPTEATIITTQCDLTARGLDGGEVPLGTCLPHTSIAVRTKDRTCEPGDVGEIHIAGAGVARGYLHAPRLTAERFVPDAGTRWGGRAYRTGDLAVRTPRGDLVFSGRHDNQIKLNGHRIQLEEVEAALVSHNAIGASAVLLRDNRSGSKQLVAYCVLDERQTSLPFEMAPLSVMELRAFLRDVLPEFMIPGEFCFLEKFILNASGKIDRTKLPELGHLDRKRRRLPEHEYPRAGLEARLARIWCDVLDLDVHELGACDPFEYLGGNSLYGIQVRYKAQQAGLLFKASDMHLRQTIRGLAGCCEASDGAWKRARHALVDYKKYLSGIGTVVLRGAARRLDLRSARRARRLSRTIGRFYEGLSNKDDVFYVYFGTHLLHWVWTTLRFVPPQVNVVLIASGLTGDEEAWVRARIDRPFLHLDQMTLTNAILDALFEVNTRNFGWLDPDCFIMNPSLFDEMRQLAPDTAINCVWTHAACGPTKRPFHVLETYFLFFNISAIEALGRQGIMPRPSATAPTLSQARALHGLIPADASRNEQYSFAFAHRLLTFDFARLVLFQLLANTCGFRLNRVRFFTELDTFNPYNYYSDEAIHVFPTIRQFASRDPSDGDQQHRLMSDYLLMSSMLHELPRGYEARRQFIEGKLREGNGLVPVETMRSMIAGYLAARGVTDKTFSRDELRWLVPDAMREQSLSPC